MGLLDMVTGLLGKKKSFRAVAAVPFPACRTSRASRRSPAARARC